jgi:hypothetical protein
MVTKIVVDGKSKRNLARRKKGKGRDQAQIVVEGRLINFDNRLILAYWENGDLTACPECRTTVPFCFPPSIVF